MGCGAWASSEPFLSCHCPTLTRLLSISWPVRPLLLIAICQSTGHVFIQPDFLTMLPPGDTHPGCNLTELLPCSSR